MTAAYASGRVVVHHGDCLEVLAGMGDCSVDAVVTDPPYGLEFMGKDWDGANGFRRSLNPADVGRDDPFGRTSRTSPEYRAGKLFQSWCESWATECLRVLKPGGWLLAFGGTRTWHRLVCAVEDVGFEIRDSIAWLHSQGFPKSLDVSKAIDRAAGAEREVVGQRRMFPRPSMFGNYQDGERTTDNFNDDPRRLVTRHDEPVTAPATPEAARWQGWGTALKPAHEPICVARKPLAGSVAGNVLAWGTGGLNVDGCRIEPTGESRPRVGEPSQETRYTASGGTNFAALPGVRGGDPAGRWPANVVLDEGAAVELDRQSGERPSGGTPNGEYVNRGLRGNEYVHRREERPGDSGGASRFLYVAKADASERPRVNGVAHATVKPLALMRWLVRLVTPPDGLVLDPFAGSGTTGEAALLEGFRAVLVEREAEYLPLIEARMHRRTDPVAWVNAHRDPDGEPDLFSALS